MTIPWEPLSVDAGCSVSESGSGAGVSVSRQLAVAVPARAVIVRCVTFVTGLVWIGKLFPPWPSRSVNVAGTVAAGEELARLIANPPGGARPSQNPAKQPTSRSTIPMLSAPPVIWSGANCKGVSLSLGGSSVMVVDAEVPL